MRRNYTFLPRKRRCSARRSIGQILTQSQVFAGKDASRALGMSSVKPEDVTAQWEDLPAKEKKVLDDWMTFFSKRYNVVGKVVA